MIGQIWAVAVLNIQSIVSRSGASAVIVVGTGGVVGVLTLVLSMAGGLDAVFKNSIEPDRAIVLRDGSIEEMSSVIPGNHLSLIRSIPEVAIAAGELYGVADIEKRSSGTPANLVVRGTEAQSFQVRPELSITQGRNFQPGRNEAIVGVGAHREFLGLDVGSQIEVRGIKWLVVGLFEDDGSAAESEIWVDLPMAASAFRRGNTLTTVRLRLNRSEGLNAVNENMKANPELQTKAVSEERFYSEQSEGATKVIRVFGNVVVVIMAIGAIFAALNTMYSAVAARTFEIATLRAIGFGGLPVAVSVMVEAMVLAVAGGVLGALVVYVMFHNFSVTTMNQAAFSQLSFSFDVSPEVMSYGLVWAVALGFLGGLLPAVRAARLPVTVALRGE